MAKCSKKCNCERQASSSDSDEDVSDRKICVQFEEASSSVESEEGKYSTISGKTDYADGDTKPDGIIKSSLLIK